MVCVCITLRARLVVHGKEKHNPLSARLLITNRLGCNRHPAHVNTVYACKH